MASHAEGIGTKAAQTASHAEGAGTSAEVSCAHAEGEYTKALSIDQHVQGRYNIEDGDGKYAHIVGNGTYQERSNAHTLDWQGNAWYAGMVEGRGIILVDTTDSAKRYLVQITNGQLVTSEITETAEE